MTPLLLIFLVITFGVKKSGSPNICGPWAYRPYSQPLHLTESFCTGTAAYTPT